MISVRIPTDKNFNYKQCKKLFKKYRDKLNDYCSFKEITENAYFYSFYDDDTLFSCLYFFDDNGKLYVNGFGKRHYHLQNIECLKTSLNWFNCDIYANSVQKPAILCLLRCGFKKIGENLYIYRR